MRKIIASIYSFGVNKYIEKKVFQGSPVWHQRLFKAARAEYVPSAYGPLMKANWGDETFKMCYFGSYGKGLSGFLGKIVDDFTFLDIGANQGIYTLVALMNKKCCQVVAFEPVAKTFTMLSNNVGENRSTSRVKLVNKAISSTNGIAQITIQKSHSGKASLESALCSVDNTEAQVTEKISTINSSELEKIVGIAANIIVKIDVEGHEEVVIDELIKSSFFHNVSAIFYEVDKAWTRKSELKAILEDHAFNYFTQYGRGKHYDILACRA
jgi:FkbM family methyltransferase